ncbi:hypothetical protein LDENG_00117340, partial [Lucifuga dentata]
SCEGCCVQTVRTFTNDKIVFLFTQLFNCLNCLHRPIVNGFITTPHVTSAAPICFCGWIIFFTFHREAFQRPVSSHSLVIDGGGSCNLPLPWQPLVTRCSLQ